MTLYYPSPFGLRAQISVDGLSHKFEVLVNVDEDTPIGTSPSAIVTHLKNGTDGVLSDFIIDLFTAIRATYDTNATISSVTLWKYAANSYDATFWASSTYSQAGTRTPPAQTLSHYQMMTFRSLNGGISKLILPENYDASNIVQDYGGLDAEAQDIADIILAPESPVVARDNGYLFAFIHMSGGQNEKFFRIRNR